MGQMCKIRYFYPAKAEDVLREKLMNRVKSGH